VLPVDGEAGSVIVNDPALVSTNKMSPDTAVYVVVLAVNPVIAAVV
jgi:hypothetical protein